MAACAEAPWNDGLRIRGVPDPNASFPLVSVAASPIPYHVTPQGYVTFDIDEPGRDWVLHFHYGGIRGATQGGEEIAVSSLNSPCGGLTQVTFYSEVAEPVIAEIVGPAPIWMMFTKVGAERPAFDAMPDRFFLKLD